MDQNQVFQHVHTFPCMKVHVYAYASFGLRTHMYTQFGQGETYVYLFFFHSMIMNCDLSSK